MPNIHVVEFLAETGLMLAQAMGAMEDIPVAPIVVVPYEHGKPFVTEEEKIRPGMQMSSIIGTY